jgi:hypothetical protein
MEEGAMKKLTPIIVVASILLISGCAGITAKDVFDPTLFNDWSNEDIAREVGCQVLHGIDGLQTYEIARDPGEHWEKNPVLGEHPDPGTVIAYFVGGAIAHLFISDLLTPKYRKWFQWGTMAVSAYWVQNNLGVGLNVGF